MHMTYVDFNDNNKNALKFMRGRGRGEREGITNYKPGRSRSSLYRDDLPTILYDIKDGISFLLKGRDFLLLI